MMNGLCKYTFMKNTLTRFTVVLVLAACSPLYSQKTTPKPSAAPRSLPALLDAKSFAGLKYRMVGPSRGGRVTAVTGVPQKPYTFYMGATGGGVWRTTDGGLSWNNLSDTDFKTGSIGAVEVAPSDPNIIYVGTGSADPRGNVSPGDGIYKSTSGGISWTSIGLPKAGQIGKIVIHPTNPDRVWVGVLGNVFGSSAERGVFRTKDGGKTWEKVLFISDRTGTIELVIDPSNPNVLYAGMWTAERKPWTLIDGSIEGGVWKTNDGGDNWIKLEGGLPKGVVGRIGIAVSPVRPNRVWVQIEAENETKGGLYLSENSGNTFTRINREHNIRQRAWYYSRIYADPKNENTVYVLNTNFMRSIDGGKSFSRVGVPHGDTHVLWINPDNPEVMIQGNDGGACISVNGGKTWSTQNNQPTAEFYRLSLDQQFPYRLYAAQQDNSTISVPSRFDEALSPQQQWFSVGGGESGHIAVDPRNPNLVYAGNYIGQITRTDLSKGYRKDVVAYPQMHDGQAPRDIRYRFQWNAPIRLSPHDPQVLYHCSQYVHRSKDGGYNWEVISPDLTTNNGAYQDIPGGPIQHDHTGVELFTTIFAFEESPLTPGELWAGSDDGLLHISRDNGLNWKNITPPTMPKNATINHIALSTHAAGRAFIAVHKYRENDFRPYIFMTSDFGQTWKLLSDGVNGIPNDHWVRVVLEDPNRKGLLYAGTEYGMHVSFDEGKNWQAFQLNLPHTPIADMAVKNKDLVIATHGRSFWILDDLSPLYTLNLDNEQTPVLFAPRTAYRSQLSNFRTPGGPDRAPNGAVLYFNLPKSYSDTNKVVITITDPQGKIRKEYSTSPKAGQDELDAKKGLNRFEWTLGYETPELQDNSYFSLADTGPVKAFTGQHTVTMTYLGKKYEQPLVVMKDPRWTQSDEDLLAQHDLTMKVKALLNSCHTTIGALRSIRRQIKENLDKARTFKPENLKALEAVATPITDGLNKLEALLIQTQSQSSQDPINYPPKLDDQMAYLYSIVNDQDDRPTQGCYTRYEDLKKEFAPHQTNYEQLKSKALTEFNRVLSENGLQMIMAK
jgi:photosystem II stability/assembly factor-like uncharacterized protein